MLVASLALAFAVTAGAGGDLHTASGATFSLPELLAHGPAVIVFWNSWLPGADAFARLVPEIESAAHEHGWPGVLVVFQEDKPGAAARLGSGAGTLVHVIDPHGELLRRFHVTKAPAVLLVEKNGTVRARCGPGSAEVHELVQGMADR
jgi:hypothetical protein